MKLLCRALIAALAATASAAPTFIWSDKADSSFATEHISHTVPSSEIVSSVLSKDDSSLDVLFIVDRSNDGHDSLSHLASSGALPHVASKYEHARAVHHNVDNINSASMITQLVKDELGFSNSHLVLEINLDEFNTKLTANPLGALGSDPSVSQKKKYRRAQAINKARVLIIQVSPAESSALDSAMKSAIESNAVNNVMLSGQRSTAEIRMERDVESRRRMKKRSAKKGRRRLDQQEEGDDNADDEDLSGVYYVNMTPNILAGILFTLLFSFVVTTGINCMGAIQGGDVYASKYPTVGREA